ncbi:MAG: S41 family peptidase [Pseudomonadota bacterium]
MVLSAAAGLTACGGGGGDGGLTPITNADPCSINGQKQFVLDNMRFWYLWNDRLPANVNLDAYATPQDLLAFLSSFSPDNGSGQPVDTFSFINTVEADQQFFGEGKFEGFGFNSRFVAANDLRLSRVFTDSPAFRAGLRRGQRILALNGRTVDQIEAAEGVGAVFGANSTIEFLMRRQDGSEFPAIVTVDIVTIDPVPQWRIIPGAGGQNIGYLELSTFISTASAELDTAFAEFQQQGVRSLILDLRYNGGGLVSIAELLGDYIDGSGAAGLVFSKTLFNADRGPDNNSEALFQNIANSLDVDNLVVIATRGTASASELVANGLVTDATVTIVGDNTFGKPVGQIGLEFCEQLLRPTAFQTVNSLDFGDFFGGLPVDCPAADDLNVAVGADADPNLVAALAFLETGSCPVVSLPGVAGKPTDGFEPPRPELRGPPWREYADAY